jgi:ATP-dependent DNA helicase 2 subunit 1
MADFLASFNFDAETPQANNVQLASVDDLKNHLAGILSAKVTATRTEHVAITVELRATVQLVIQLSESENDALTGLASIDPSLGGVASTGINAEQADGRILRAVKVHDALTNQPQDDPALQRAIAKHVIDAIGATDQSTWSVREVSRTSQGWTFTYICKDSLQMWTRQTSKARSIPVIGEYSYKDADPVLMSSSQACPSFHSLC